MFEGRGVGHRYKCENYLPIKTFKGKRLDAIEGVVSVDRERSSLGTTVLRQKEGE